MVVGSYCVFGWCCLCIMFTAWFLGVSGDALCLLVVIVFVCLLDGLT